MAGALPEVSAICEDLTEKMNALFTATLQEEREQILEEFRPAEEPEEEPEENAALPPLLLNALRSFREERREKEPTAPLIAPLVVDTRVKARDVFGKAD